MRIPKDRKDENSEFFNKFSLKSIYTKLPNGPLETVKSDLTSNYYQNFIGCGLIVTTAQDGFLYYLPKINGELN